MGGWVLEEPRLRLNSAPVGFSLAGAGAELGNILTIFGQYSYNNTLHKILLKYSKVSPKYGPNVVKISSQKLSRLCQTMSEYLIILR